MVTVSEDPDGKGPLPTKTKRLIEVEPHRIEFIAMVGRIHITSHATRFCLERGIPIAWMKRNGDYLGRVVPELSRTADLRLAHYHTATDSAAALALAIKMVTGKLSNAMAILALIRSNREGIPPLGQAIRDVRSVREAAEQADSIERLMGFEGAGASAYFTGLRFGFDGDIKFPGRKRRPPPDPANALLSFGYVILTNWLTSALEARGLDPYVGFLHAGRSGKPSLALDLLEELRCPVVDRFVIRSCNRRQLRPEHFKADEERGGVRLTRPGLRKFFRIWEAYLDGPLPGDRSGLSIEELMRQQVNRLAAHIRNHEDYDPLTIRAGVSA